MIFLTRCILLLSILLVSLIGAAQASTLTKAIDQPSVILINGATADLLTPAAPNSAGVTKIQFTSFVINRPLQIVNTTDTVRSAAKLIVIEATSVSISSSIEILGEKADLLIINKSNSLSSSCVACSVANVGRLTLAAGTLAYDGNAWPNKVTLTTSSNININSLSAKGVGAVELIAPRVILNGTTSTQLKAAYSNDGSYLLSDSGGLKVGYGSVTVLAGFDFNYKTLDVYLSGQTNTYGIEQAGTLSSLAVKFVSNSPIKISGTIDTTSDIASSTTYNGQLAIVEESIKVSTLNTSKNIYQNGKLYSDAIVQVASSGELINNGTISSNAFDGTAGGKLTNVGAVNSKTIQIAAGSIENNGLLNGRQVFVGADQYIENRFGGRILGYKVALTSDHSYVRNGSLYPFKPKNDFSVVASADTPTDIGLSTMAFSGVSFQGATKVSNLSALIVGDIVSINAATNVENINPYFEYTLDPEAWRSGIVFNPTKADRVQLVADTALDIHSGTYVVNSSAIMGVNDPAGHFYVISPNVANERYTTEVIIEPFHRTEPTSTGQTTLNGYESLLVVFSPPGVMYSFAPLGFEFSTTNGGFINNTSYFEVLNDAKFVAKNSDSESVAGKVTSIGLALQEKYQNSSTIVTKSTKGCTSPFTYYGSGQDAEAQGRLYYDTCGTWGNSSSVDLSGQTEEQMKGTLFSVKGDLNGETTGLYGTNHNVIGELDDKLISDYTATNTWSKDEHKSGSGYFIDYTMVSETELSDDGKYLNTVIAPTTIDAQRTITSSPGCDGGDCKQDIVEKAINDATNQIYDSESKSWSTNVEEFLAAQYKAIKDALMALIAAFDSWWNS